MKLMRFVPQTLWPRLPGGAKTRLAIVSLLMVALTSVSAQARKPADVFKQQIIVSKESFPSSFKSDRAFIRYMKKVRTNRLVYPDSNQMTIRFMAFFAAPHQTTEFTALIYDMTDRNRLVDTIPISPNQRVTRILAGAIDLEREQYAEDRQYQLIIAIGNRALAKTQFTIRESKKNRAARLKRERELRKGRTVDFTKPQTP